nr:hypothetical protein [Candidatus Woesearchaeota archaeon]
MIEEIMAGISLGILVFLILSLVFAIKSKKFEKREVLGISDMTIISLILFGIMILFDLIMSLDGLNFFVIDGLDLDILVIGINLILIPLLLVLFLAIEFSLRDLQ